jgi:hypothetical protein
MHLHVALFLDTFIAHAIHANLSSVFDMLSCGVWQRLLHDLPILHRALRYWPELHVLGPALLFGSA